MHVEGSRVIVGVLEANDDYRVTRNTVHELALVWDNRCGNCKSETMMTITGRYYDDRGKYVPVGRMPSKYPSEDTPNGAWEDWAESVTNVVLPDPIYDPWDSRRQDYVRQNWIQIIMGGFIETKNDTLRTSHHNTFLACRLY